jgi:hypothetical protein
MISKCYIFSEHRMLKLSFSFKIHRPMSIYLSWARKDEIQTAVQQCTRQSIGRKKDVSSLSLLMRETFCEEGGFLRDEPRTFLTSNWNAAKDWTLDMLSRILDFGMWLNIEWSPWALHLEWTARELKMSPSDSILISICWMSLNRDRPSSKILYLRSQFIQIPARAWKKESYAFWRAFTSNGYVEPACHFWEKSLDRILGDEPDTHSKL